jgi:hypothetical protein
MRFGLRSLAALLVAIGSYSLGTTNAGALDAARAVSFVGTYKIHGKITGAPVHLMGTFVVAGDGTVQDQNGVGGQWTSSGRAFSMTFPSEVFVGVHTKTGISSKTHPGTFTISSPDLSGTWWAVKVG